MRSWADIVTFVRRLNSFWFIAVSGINLVVVALFYMLMLLEFADRVFDLSWPFRTYIYIYDLSYSGSLQVITELYIKTTPARFRFIVQMEVNPCNATFILCTWIAYSRNAVLTMMITASQNQCKTILGFPRIQIPFLNANCSLHSTTTTYWFATSVRTYRALTVSSEQPCWSYWVASQQAASHLAAAVRPPSPNQWSLASAL